MTDGPKRIQLQRIKGWKMPPDGVKIDRATEWGNPFRITGTIVLDDGAVEWLVESDSYAWRFGSREEAHRAAVELYRTWSNSPAQARLRERIKLRFRRSRPACWCGLNDPCHGDVIWEIAHA